VPRGVVRPGSAESPGMGGRVYLAQPIDGDEGVDLSGRHRRVTEQLLYDADVGAPVEQVGGEGVPEGVRGDVGEPGPFGGGPKRRPRALP